MEERITVLDKSTMEPAEMKHREKMKEIICLPLGENRRPGSTQEERPGVCCDQGRELGTDICASEPPVH